MAGFAVAVNNNGSAEPRYYVDHLHRQHVQLQQQSQLQHHQHLSPRGYPVQMFSGHMSVLAAKEAVLEPPPRRGDLVYVHCATAEDEAAEDEEEEPRGLIRSRSWLCCPGDRRADKTVPIQVEADNKDKQNAVSFPRVFAVSVLFSP